jgi:hypothetical protein
MGETHEERRPRSFIASVSYSTADQPAGPIIAALGTAIRSRHLQIRSVSLVIQWGPERLWDWEPVDTIELGAAG